MTHIPATDEFEFSNQQINQLKKIHGVKTMKAALQAWIETNYPSVQGSFQIQRNRIIIVCVCNFFG